MGAPVRRIAGVWPCEPAHLSRICAFVRRELRERYSDRVSRERLHDIELLVSEGCTNVMKHAYGWDPRGRLELRADLGETTVAIEIEDWGRGFDLEAVREPDLERPTGGGLGVFLMKRIADRVRYIRSRRSNRLRLDFMIPEGPSSRRRSEDDRRT